MKKFSLFALAAAGMLFGACADKDTVQEVQNKQDFTDGAFIGISLQLPSAQATTRANEDFNDGAASEFAVKNATLYLFEGSSEADAKYYGSYTIGTNYPNDGATNITSTYNEATLIDGATAAAIKSATDNFYAYVVLNHNSQIGTLDKSVDFATFSKNLFTGIGTAIAEGADPTATNAFPNGLIMTNSPVSAAAGGSVEAPTTPANYTTLVPLTKANIFNNADDAKKKPAACIFVERAAVKIEVISTVANDATISGTTNGGTTATEIPLVVESWQIINYEPNYYNTRQVDPNWGDYKSDYPEKCEAAEITPSTNWKGANQYRFVSGTAFAPQIPTGHAAGPYRTYFAYDPHYNADASLERPAAVDGKWISLAATPKLYGYTTENTFDVAHQTWRNTTQITFKVKFNDGNAFYNINNGSDIYTDEATVKTKLATEIQNLPAVGNALDKAVKELADADPGKHYTGFITVNFTTPSKATDGVELNIGYTITSSDGGTKTVENLATGTDSNKKKLEDAIADAKKVFTLSYHEGGYAYYNARIKHFGDYETPWSASVPYQTQTPGTTVDQIYGVTTDADNAPKRFLGRYGVVRDNWYQVTVSGITKIGTAEPVDVTGVGKDTPDDEIENYISVHVHTLPWVMRTQTVTF
jgi:hypothetical protein